MATPGFIQLPFELRHMVLSAAPDLPTLDAMIRSSPAYYATFRVSRDVILSEVLTRELAGSKVIVEGLAVSLSTLSKPESGFPGFSFGVFEREMAVSIPDATWRVPSAFAYQMAGYQKVVRDLADDFFEYALSDPAGELAKRNAHQGMTPSPTERLRVQGAFYRLWLFGSMLSRCSTYEPAENLIRKLNAAYGKWSLQEASVVHDYLLDRLRTIFQASCSDRDDSRYIADVGRLVGSPKLMDAALTRLLAAGLPAVHTVLHASPASFTRDTIHALQDEISASDAKGAWTVQEALSQLTWLTDFHYDYEARRICKEYVQWEPQWIYSERVMKNACIYDDARLRKMGLHLPDQTPKPCHWFFSLGR